MIFKKTPFNDSQTSNNHLDNSLGYILGRIANGLRPTISKDFSDNNSRITKLIEKCWNSDVKLRPSMNKVVEELNRILIKNNEGKFI